MASLFHLLLRRAQSLVRFLAPEAVVFAQPSIDFPFDSRSVLSEVGGSRIANVSTGGLVLQNSVWSRLEYSDDPVTVVARKKKEDTFFGSLTKKRLTLPRKH